MRGVLNHTNVAIIARAYVKHSIRTEFQPPSRVILLSVRKVGQNVVPIFEPEIRAGAGSQIARRLESGEVDGVPGGGVSEVEVHIRTDGPTRVNGHSAQTTLVPVCIDVG